MLAGFLPVLILLKFTIASNTSVQKPPTLILICFSEEKTYFFPDTILYFGLLNYIGQATSVLVRKKKKKKQFQNSGLPCILPSAEEDLTCGSPNLVAERTDLVQCPDIN